MCVRFRLKTKSDVGRRIMEQIRCPEGGHS